MTPVWEPVGRTKATPTACKTGNGPACDEARKRRGSLAIWLDPSMIREAALTGKRARLPDDRGAAIRTWLTLKVLFGMALRRQPGWSRACCG